MNRSDQDIHQIYLVETSALRVERSKLGCLVALVFMPLGGIVDWLIYPEQFFELSVVRIVCVTIILTILPMHYLELAKNHVKAINLSYPMVIVIAMCTIIMMTEGISGPYYAGLSMLILGVSLLLPLSFPEASFFVLYTIASYLGFGYFWEQQQLNPAAVFNNIYFLTATGLIAGISSYFAEKARFREFQLTYELDQRNRELAELDKIKSDFYANISHEFRTPLTLILAPVEELLSRNNMDSATEGHLSHIRDNAFRLLKLVNDLLDIQKLEDKKEEFLEKKPVKLNSLLENTVKGMETLAERRALTLKYSDIEQDLVVIADASALEKIFINLINNSIKFTEPGGEVQLRLSQKGNRCFVDVTDTGQGIHESDLENIFERFQQVDSSSTRKHQGTGLGLALVKELTHLHEGDIEVKSRVGEGTTMRVWLPLAGTNEEQNILPLDETEDSLQSLHKEADRNVSGIDEIEQDSLPVLKEPIPVALKINSVSKPKLLIVEDEPGIREYLRETMKQEYEVSTAIDGPEGLFMASEIKPDLMILDWMLPKMDGLTVCAAIKEDNELRHIKLMLLTAKSDEKSKIDALNHGADDFLTKPFSTVEVKSRLRNLWNTSQLQRDVERQNDELQKTLSDLKSTQGQLIQSEKLNALGRLAAGLLHEVNNPLNFAFATFQLLEREDVISQDEYANDLMKDIREGMERIAAIVKDLKAFAYPEQADLRAIFDITTAVESAIRFTSAKSVNAQILNRLEFIQVLGSQSHIVQLLVNLIENALDAMEEAGTTNPRVVISSTSFEEGRVRILISDNGPGIPDDIRGKIFDPFYTTKEVGSGLGMGLSICHTIINNHGGTLDIESTSEEGTTFSFDLADAAANLDKDVNNPDVKVSGEKL